MDKIQESIQEMNTLDFDLISVRATVIEATCFVFATNAPEGSPATVKFTSSSVEAAVTGAFEMLKFWLASRAA